MLGEDTQLYREDSVYIKQSANAVAYDAAAAFMRLSRQAAAMGMPFRVALSGGSTPRLLYDILTSDSFKGEIPWEKVQFFFGDERFVAHDHPDSNYKLAEDALFSKVGVSRENIFPMPTEGVSPDEAAAQYEATLREAFGVAEGETPVFDLIYLGMGDDGHTASIFPNTDVIHESERLVVAHYIEKLAADRITLTPLALNAAKDVIFMVAGESKGPALREVLEGAFNPDEYPSQIIRDSDGRVTWLIDKAAASRLEGEYPQT